jgi:hypothetical protein
MVLNEKIKSLPEQQLLSSKMLLVHEDLDPTANTNLRNRVSKKLINKAFDFSYFELTEENFIDN